MQTWPVRRLRPDVFAEMTRLELFLGGCCVFLVGLLLRGPAVTCPVQAQAQPGCQVEATQWYNAKFGTEKSLLDAVYGQIFGGDAVNYVNTKILKWSEVKADELDSNVRLKPTDVVLDLGCGPGFIAREVRKRVAVVYCWDVNYDMSEYARRKHAGALRYGVTAQDKVTTDPLGGIADNSLDVFYAYAVFIHHDVYTITSYFEALSRKAKLGGRIYFQIVPGETFRPDDPTWREHYRIWQGRPNFWIMAMHVNGRDTVARIARTYGFRQVVAAGHSGKAHPSQLDGPNRPQNEGNILFCKVVQHDGKTSLLDHPLTVGPGTLSECAAPDVPSTYATTLGAGSHRKRGGGKRRGRGGRPGPE